MCSIAAVLSLRGQPVPDLERRLAVMNELQRHRGPDGEGSWVHPNGGVGLGHRRLAVLDLERGGQPATDGNWVVSNAEVYNYPELGHPSSDTQAILLSYRRWGPDCVERFRGMFALALWDESRQELFCARDRFGVKPLYYAVVDDLFYCASEAKALLPFLPSVQTDPQGLLDYLAFQYCLGGKTLFQGIQQLPPGHTLTVSRDRVQQRRYWEPPRPGETPPDLAQRFEDAVALCLRSDVPLGIFVSGGLDSSLIACQAARLGAGSLLGFHGRFELGPRFDESAYALEVSRACGFPLHILSIGPQDLVDHLRSVIYHLDYPVAGPGAFSQYMVSGLAASHRKVVLGGQGADELFGGYARYQVAEGQGVPGYEALMGQTRGHHDLGGRYFRLIHRMERNTPEVRWELLGDYCPRQAFLDLFEGNVAHFDLMGSLPALLHVEDRVTMAHGLESRVPFLDHLLAPTLPTAFQGPLKQALRHQLGGMLPPRVRQRSDKMGFPTPLVEWLQTDLLEFTRDILTSSRALSRPWVDNRAVLRGLDHEPQFGRRLWGFLCLELWQQEFHDQAYRYRGLLERQEV